MIGLMSFSGIIFFNLFCFGVFQTYLIVNDVTINEKIRERWNLKINMGKSGSR